MMKKLNVLFFLLLLSPFPGSAQAGQKDIVLKIEAAFPDSLQGPLRAMVLALSEHIEKSIAEKNRFLVLGKEENPGQRAAQFLLEYKLELPAMGQILTPPQPGGLSPDTIVEYSTWVSAAAKITDISTGESVLNRRIAALGKSQERRSPARAPVQTGSVRFYDPNPDKAGEHRKKAFEQAQQKFGNSWAYVLEQAFPYELKVTELLDRNKTRAKEVAINGGAEFDIAPNQYFSIYTIREYELLGKVFRYHAPLGRLRVADVQPGRSACKVNYGEKEVLEAIEAGKELYCERLFF